MHIYFLLWIVSKSAAKWFWKTYVAFHLWKDLKDKKSLYSYKSSKRKSKKNVRLLLNRTDNLVTMTTEKTEVLSAFFKSPFFDRTAFSNPRCPRRMDKH